MDLLAPSPGMVSLTDSLEGAQVQMMTSAPLDRAVVCPDAWTAPLQALSQ